jgi:hypothetical protein
MKLEEGAWTSVKLVNGLWSLKVGEHFVANTLERVSDPALAAHIVRKVAKEDQAVLAERKEQLAREQRSVAAQEARIAGLLEAIESDQETESKP